MHFCYICLLRIFAGLVLGLSAAPALIAQSATPAAKPATPSSPQAKQDGLKRDQTASAKVNQVGANASDSTAQKNLTLSAQLNQAMDDGYAYLKKGHLAAAEAKVTSINLLPSKTVEWYLHNAANFLHLAFRAKEQDDAQTAELAAKRAMLHTIRASKLVGDDPAMLVRISDLRAVINERFLSNSTEVSKQRIIDIQQIKEAEKRVGSK